MNEAPLRNYLTHKRAPYYNIMPLYVPIISFCSYVFHFGWGREEDYFTFYVHYKHSIGSVVNRPSHGGAIIIMQLAIISEYNNTKSLL